MTPLQRKLFLLSLRREREEREKAKRLTADRPHADNDPHVNVVIEEGCTRTFAPDEGED